VPRLVPSLLCLAFTASLYASVPAAAPAGAFHQGSASVQLERSPIQERLPLTAAPADNLSFYIEFYGTEPLPPKAERKSGLLHWLSSTLKKTAQKVNFLP
jgi:hypothetical protein